MSQQISLKEAERRILSLAMFKDGLWDIFLGLVLVTMSLYSITRGALGPALNLLLFAGIWGLMLIGLYLIRNQVIAPRVGLVRFGSEQKTRIKRLNLVTIILVLGTFAFYILVVSGMFVEPEWRALPQWVQEFDVDIIFTAIIIGLFSLAAYNLGVTRLYLYGWLMGLGSLAGTVLGLYRDYTFNYPVAIAGGIMLLIGLILLVRFLRHYPVQATEA
jgi:hypothetical protein